MASTKDKKKKRRRRRVRPPPAVAVKATDVPKAIPTAILLEQQAFGRLIKNARTAGLEINQSVYDRYQENIHVRSVLARHNRPDLGERLGYQARQMVRNLVVPRGHAPARERSQRIAAEPDPRSPVSPARPGEIEAGPVVTLDDRLREGAKTAIDVSSPPVEGRKQEPMPLSTPVTTSSSRPNLLQRAFSRMTSPRRRDKSADESGYVNFSDLKVTPTFTEAQLERIDEIKNMTPRKELQFSALTRETKQLDQRAIKQTPPDAARVTRAAMRRQESSSVTPPTEE